MTYSYLDNLGPWGILATVQALIRPPIALLLGTAAALIGCGSSKVPTALNVSAGGQHVCATLSDSSVRCWGSNAFGQLGDNTLNDSAFPVTVLQLQAAQSVAAGADHTCAILSNGSVQCWGDNDHGQLGDGTVIERSVAGQFVGLARAGKCPVRRATI